MRRAAVVASAGLPLLSIAACGGPSRSVASYCSYFWSRAVTLHDRYQQGEGDPLQSVVNLFGVPTDLAQLFKNLDQRAPDDIEPDVATLADSFSKQSDELSGSAANPFAGLLGGLVAGLQSTGAWQRVNTWTNQNCPPPPGVATGA